MCHARVGPNLENNMLLLLQSIPFRFGLSYSGEQQFQFFVFVFARCLTSTIDIYYQLPTGCIVHPLNEVFSFSSSFNSFLNWVTLNHSRTWRIPGTKYDYPWSE